MSTMLGTLRGPDGKAGTRGEPGTDGAPGAKGPAANIVMGRAAGYVLSQAEGKATLTFDKPFTAPPALMVFASHDNQPTSYFLHCTVTDKSATGFTVAVSTHRGSGLGLTAMTRSATANPSAATVTLSWVAIGQVA